MEIIQSIDKSKAVIVTELPGKTITTKEYVKKLLVLQTAAQAQLDDATKKLTQIETAIGKQDLDAIKAAIK